MFAFEPGAEAPAGREPKTSDTRSFIMSRPVIEEASARSQQQVQPPALPRTVQARYAQSTNSLWDEKSSRIVNIFTRH